MFISWDLKLSSAARLTQTSHLQEICRQPSMVPLCSQSRNNLINVQASESRGLECEVGWGFHFRIARVHMDCPRISPDFWTRRYPRMMQCMRLFTNYYGPRNFCLGGTDSRTHVFVTLIIKLRIVNDSKIIHFCSRRVWFDLVI